MLPLDALIRNELLAAKGGAALPPMSGLAARGNWFPDFKPLMENFRQTAIKKVKALLRSEHLPRANRKAILTRLFDSNGRLTPRGLETLKANRKPSDMQQLEREYPISETFYLGSQFDRYLLGKISADALAKEMADGIFRPDNLVAAFKDRYAEEFNAVFSWVRKFGGDILGMILQVQEDLTASPPPADLPKAEAKAKIKSLINRHMEFGRIGARVIDRFRNTKGLEGLSDSKSALERCAALKVLDAIAVQIVRDAAQSLSWKPIGSIGGEVMHAAYIPYVDVWRGDKPFCELIKKSKSSGQTKIVSERSGLRDAIETALKERQSGKI
jgi:hypothetical protein